MTYPLSLSHPAFGKAGTVKQFKAIVNPKVSKSIVSYPGIFAYIFEDFQLEIPFYVYIIPEIAELDDDIPYSITPKSFNTVYAVETYTPLLVNLEQLIIPLVKRLYKALAEAWDGA